MLQGCSWRDVLWKVLLLFAFWFHFGSQSFVWSLVVRFISKPVFKASAHPFSQWSFGPSRQASSRGQPNDGRNESFRASIFVQVFCIACPYRCSHCLDGSVRYFATHDQQPHGLLMCVCSFLWWSVAVKRLAPCCQRCQNKISFDTPSLN